MCRFLDSLWLWPVRDVILTLPLHLVGTIHFLWFSEPPGYMTVWKGLQMAVLCWDGQVAILGVLVCVEREVHAGTAAQPVRLIVRHEPVRM